MTPDRNPDFENDPEEDLSDLPLEELLARLEAKQKGHVQPTQQQPEPPAEPELTPVPAIEPEVPTPTPIPIAPPIDKHPTDGEVDEVVVRVFFADEEKAVVSEPGIGQGDSDTATKEKIEELLNKIRERQQERSSLTDEPLIEIEDYPSQKSPRAVSVGDLLDAEIDVPDNIDIVDSDTSSEEATLVEKRSSESVDDLSKTRRTPPEETMRRSFAEERQQMLANKRKRQRRTIVTMSVLFLGLLIAGFMALIALYQADRLPSEVASILDEGRESLDAAVPVGAQEEATVEEPAPENSPTPVLPAEQVEPTEEEAPTEEVTEDGVIEQGGASMVYIPGGNFIMGNDDNAGESPAHAVTLDPYYIDQYEVTNALWAECVADGACVSPASRRDYADNPYYGEPEFDDYPVLYVNWGQAQAYCEWRGSSLPTEAQWEMAARYNAEDDALVTYPWGDDAIRENLNYCDSSCLLEDRTLRDQNYDDGYPQMSPVGAFEDDLSPNGLYDMGGNMAEWVADWFSGDYYAGSPDENPIGPEIGSARVVRGGAWSLPLNFAYSTRRAGFAPETQAASIGFRCAVSADEVGGNGS